MNPSSLRCHHVSADLIQLLDGELDAIRIAQVGEHFRTCDGCARFYQSLREQLVLHEWAADESFDLDEAEDCLPEDIPDYAGLAERLRGADLGDLGRVLYEILKAEFLFDYGDGIAAAQEPIDDPRAERARAVGLVDDLRDWHDADEIEGVDLLEVARRFHPPGIDDNRLDQLSAGMAVVGALAPELRLAATYYQALAHVKAGREARAAERLETILAAGKTPLERAARIALATIPALLGGRPQESIAGLKACLIGDAHDAIVHYNLAKAYFIQAGGRLDADGLEHLTLSRGADPALIDRQLGLPSEKPLKRAWIAQSSALRTSVSS